jgi:hypothetical protein
VAEQRRLLPALVVEGGNLVLECGHANANIIGLADGAGNGGVPLFVDAEATTNLAAWSEVPAASVDLGVTFATVRVPADPPPGRWVRLRIVDPNF